MTQKEKNKEEKEEAASSTFIKSEQALEKLLTVTNQHRNK
jgi:hypothetical protein